MQDLFFRDLRISNRPGILTPMPELVPCACGCGRLVKSKPVYFELACRKKVNMIAWRKRHPEKARELSRKYTAKHRAKKKKA